MNTCNQGLTTADLTKAAMRASMEINHDEQMAENMTICAVVSRVFALEEKTEAFGKELAENTRVTAQIKEDTEILIELVQAGRKAGRFSLAVGRAFAWAYKIFLKFILPTVVGLAAIWAALKGTKT